MVRNDGCPETLFLDAEGTLYTPKAGHSYSEFWDEGEPTVDRAAALFQLDPQVPQVLRELRKRRVHLAVASKHREGLLRSLLIHFGVWHLFDDVLVGDDKAALVTDYLKRLGRPKEKAMMVGDSPRLDCYPLREAGVPAVLLRRDRGGETRDPPEIESLRELLTIAPWHPERS